MAGIGEMRTSSSSSKREYPPMPGTSWIDSWAMLRRWAVFWRGNNREWNAWVQGRQADWQAGRQADRLRLEEKQFRVFPRNFQAAKSRQLIRLGV